MICVRRACVLRYTTDWHGTRNTGLATASARLSADTAQARPNPPPSSTNDGGSAPQRQLMTQREGVDKAVVRGGGGNLKAGPRGWDKAGRLLGAKLNILLHDLANPCKIGHTKDAGVPALPGVRWSRSRKSAFSEAKSTGTYVCGVS